MTATAANDMPTALSTGDRTETAIPRRPPTNVQFLLPVWGDRYIRQFLTWSLPTFLAPGNIPAVARSLPCKFVFLTSSQDAEFLRDQPQYRHLASICPVEIRDIDALITGDNYSTTITLAYEQAVRAAGPTMLDTCFFFLISDYLVADGSFANVLARVRSGASGILAGNFQVIEEDASQTLRARFVRQGNIDIVLPARELVAWALDHLHAMTAANTVNFPLCHSAHSNRLFWRVDRDTLIGRFYLMHMICIRPELTDFVIGASCDYSFIPEMCPSQRVEILTDSDEYLVVEMQPRNHEIGFLKLGQTTADRLAATLSEWTTARHRENANSAVIFHAGEIPGATGSMVDESQQFVDQVTSRMTASPQPHRDHPYWLGAIAAHHWATSGRLNKNVPSSPRRTGLRLLFANLVHRLRIAVLGKPPRVRILHPRWPDYQAMRHVLSRISDRQDKRYLVVCDSPAFMLDQSSGLAEHTEKLEPGRLLGLGSAPYASLLRRFDGCVVALLGDQDIKRARALLDRIRPLLVDGAFLLLVAINGGGNAVGKGFHEDIVSSATQFLDMDMWLTDVRFVSASRLRLAVIRIMGRISAALVRRPFVYFPLAIPLALLLAPVSLACNWSALRNLSETIEPGASCSSMWLELHKSSPPANATRSRHQDRTLETSDVGAG